MEIKFSTLWTDNEVFKFQQLRDPDYDYCFMLGVSLFDAQVWFVPKGALAEDRPPTLVPQHRDGSGRDTKWLSFVAAGPPDWMGEFGGRLSEVRFLIEEATALRA